MGRGRVEKGEKEIGGRKGKEGVGAPGNQPLPDQFQTVSPMLAPDWGQNTKDFCAQSASSNSGVHVVRSYTNQCTKASRSPCLSSSCDKVLLEKETFRLVLL